MGVLFNRRRSVQPQGGGGDLNQGAPLSRGLRAAFVGGKPIDLTGRNPALIGNFVHVPTPGGLGFGYSSPGSSTVPAYLADSTNLDLPVAHTVFALVYLTTTADQVIAAKGQNGLEFASWALGVGALDGSGGTNSFTYKVRTSNASGANLAPDPIVAPTGRMVAIAGWHDGSTVRLYRDGSLVASTASSGSAPFNGAARVYIGGDQNASASGGRWFISGGIPLVLLYDRALTEGEIASLSANPWQVLEPRRIWVPVSAAGGGDTTITASVGEAGATGVTARLNSTVNAGPAAASATGVTALLNTTIVAGPGASSATGVTARLNTSVNGTPAEASATGVTASIALAGTTTISAAPGEASATGVSTHVDIMLNAAPAAASATGVSATLPRAITATPGEAAAEGLTAQLNRIFGVTVADAIAAGVTALVNNASATVGRPASDTSNSGWSASTGSDLYAMVDEVTPSATDYIVATSTGAVCELALNATGYPGTASQVLKFRASSSTGNIVIVRLKNTGGATVRSATQALTAVDTEYSITLTAPEIAAITSGSLSVELESA